MLCSPRDVFRVQRVGESGETGGRRGCDGEEAEVEGDTLAVFEIENPFVGGEDPHSRKGEAQRVDVGREDAEPVDDEKRRGDQMLEDGSDVVSDGLGTGCDASESDDAFFPEALVIAVEEPVVSSVSRERANVERESDETDKHVVDAPRSTRELRRYAKEIPNFPQKPRPSTARRERKRDEIGSARDRRFESQSLSSSSSSPPERHERKSRRIFFSRSRLLQGILHLVSLLRLSPTSRRRDESEELSPPRSNWRMKQILLLVVVSEESCGALHAG